MVNEDLKNRIEDFKTNFINSISLTSDKLDKMEKELNQLNTELSDVSDNNLDSKTSEDQISRLYEAEKSYSKYLQEKVIELELEKSVLEENSSNITDYLDIKLSLKTEFDKLTTKLMNSLALKDTSQLDKVEYQDSGTEIADNKLMLLEQKLKDKDFETKKLKQILEDKDDLITKIKTKTNADVNNREQLLNKEIDKLTNERYELKQNLDTKESELEETIKKLNVQVSNARSLEIQIKKLKEDKDDIRILKVQQELDKIIKALWKIEKNIGIFDKTSDIDVFERHLEVYSLLLGKIFDTKSHALIIDNMLKNKQRTSFNKRTIINESGVEHFIAIRILRELHDAKIIRLEEEEDHIEFL